MKGDRWGIKKVDESRMMRVQSVIYTYIYIKHNTHEYLISQIKISKDGKII